MGQCFVGFFVRTPIHLVKIYGVRTKDKVINLGAMYSFIQVRLFLNEFQPSVFGQVCFELGLFFRLYQLP